MKATTKTNPIDPQPSPLRREHVREAPAHIQQKFDGWLLRRSNLKAVILATENGWRVRRSDLATPVTDQIARMTDPGQIATVRVTQSIALLDETAAIRRVASFEALPWARMTRAEENEARIVTAQAAEQKRVADISERLEKLRAQRAEEAESQLRREAEYPRGAA